MTQKKQSKSRDTPLAELTIRRYEKPEGLNRRELIKKLCLSIGLLQPGDSRDVIVDIFEVMLDAKGKKEMLTSEEITKRVIEKRKKSHLKALGIAASNIRRQLKRMKDSFIVEAVGNQYKIIEFSNMSDLFEEKIEQILIPSILSRVKIYLAAIDKEYSQDNVKSE